jgi:N-acetylneuraminic acid mutarotase
MHSPRFVPAAVRLADGRVLVSGGRTGAEGTASAEIFNPATQKWTMTGSMPVATHTHSMVLLKSGRVLAAGGEGVDGVASIYHPTTGTWRQIASMPRPRFSMGSVRLPSGEAMFVGGYTAGFGYTNTVQIYNPATGKWRLAAPMPMAAIDGLVSVTKYGTVVVTGGLASNGVAVYNPATNTWKATAALPSPRWLGNAQNGVVLPDGRFVVPGGATDYTEVWTDQVMARNPSTGQWSPLAPLGAPSVHAAVSLAGGKFVLHAGRYPGSAEASVYQPWTNRWVPTPAMPTRGLAYGNPVMLKDGSVLVLGGQEIDESGALLDTDAAMLFRLPRHTAS